MSSTGLSEYIPTASVGEWQSFVSHPPAGVTIGVQPTAMLGREIGTVLRGSTERALMAM